MQDWTIIRSWMRAKLGGGRITVRRRWSIAYISMTAVNQRRLMARNWMPSLISLLRLAAHCFGGRPSKFAEREVPLSLVASQGQSSGVIHQSPGPSVHGKCLVALTRPQSKIPQDDLNQSLPSGKLGRCCIARRRNSQQRNRAPSWSLRCHGTLRALSRGCFENSQNTRLRKIFSTRLLSDQSDVFR